MAAVCVFCSSSSRIAASYVQLAGEVGTALAERGHTLVSGGGSVSMMGAVARAARAGGAHTVGVIPDVLLASEVQDDDADELLVVPDMRARKGLMEARSDAFLALPGGLGTLEELLEVWVARSLGMHDKPVVVLDASGLFEPLRAQLRLLTDRGFVRSTATEALVWTETVAAALEAVERGLRRPAHLRPAVDEQLESEP